MRLMRVEGDVAGALVAVCLHCGAEQVSMPPYEVGYCHCRTGRIAGAEPARGWQAPPATNKGAAGGARARPKPTLTSVQARPRRVRSHA